MRAVNASVTDAVGGSEGNNANNERTEHQPPYLAHLRSGMITLRMTMLPVAGVDGRSSAFHRGPHSWSSSIGSMGSDGTQWWFQDQNTGRLSESLVSPLTTHGHERHGSMVIPSRPGFRDIEDRTP